MAKKIGNKMKYKHIVGALIILATSSCAVVDTLPYVRVGPIKEIDTSIGKDTVIELNILLGDIVIENSLNEQLRAEMTVECPGINSDCSKRMAGLEFVQFSDSDHLTLTTNRDSFIQHYNANIKVKFFVPKSQRLIINMDAGELSVNNINSCLEVDMSAGEVTVNMSYSMVASVNLDTTFGEASLNVNEVYQNKNRVWLVGEKVKWDKGIGGCHMKVDLQAGEISVNLRG